MQDINIPNDGPTEKERQISRRLIGWYQEHKRELPWRDTADPYTIWISEIILQQTRVNQGMDYFYRFTERFPDVTSLAQASEDEVLKCWQGLGYYSRARNLHAAAKTVADRFGGVFPGRYEDVRSLKGIGEYTAAAIVSFAWNQPYPVVDGNVYRVLSRLYAEETPINSVQGKKLFASLADAVMNKTEAGLHNQAIMEFGALHCTPANPQCMFCPVREWCAARAEGAETRYPVKRQKTKVKERYFHYFHIVYDNRFTYLNRRGGKDIWEGLFEFPLIETESPADFATLSATKAFRTLFEGIPEPVITAELVNKKHVLSHRILYATFYKVEIHTEGPGLRSFFKIPCGEMEKYAIPRLIHIYMEKTG